MSVRSAKASTTAKPKSPPKASFAVTAPTVEFDCHKGYGGRISSPTLWTPRNHRVVLLNRIGTTTKQEEVMDEIRKVVKRR